MKEAVAMDTKLNCCCENCGRSVGTVEINAIAIHHHIAHLCTTCEHVLNLPKNEARFLRLARKKTYKDSNQEMQKVHQLMSMLIAVGTLFLVIIAAAGVSQGFDIVSWATDYVEIENEYISFVNINDYK